MDIYLSPPYSYQFLPRFHLTGHELHLNYIHTASKLYLDYCLDFFLLIVKGLSHLLVETMWGGDLHGTYISQNLSLTHLFFVDDILIFSNGFTREMGNLFKILSLYGRAIGMSINIIKSTLFIIIFFKKSWGLYPSTFLIQPSI